MNVALTEPIPLFIFLNRETKRGKTKLYNNAENVKHILSTLDTAKCYIESLYDGIDFSTNVTRARFENELSKVLPTLMDPIHNTLANSGIKASDIDKVILMEAFNISLGF